MLHVGKKVTKTQELPLELTLVGKTNKKNKCRISTSTEIVTGYYGNIYPKWDDCFPTRWHLMSLENELSWQEEVENIGRTF